MAVDPTRTLVFRGVLAVKATLEALLRGIFADTTLTPATYRYSQNEKDTKIKIYRSHPGRLEFYPAITISTLAHNPDILTFGLDKEMASERFVNGRLVSQTATGYVQIPVEMKIWTKQGDDRDNLTDLLIANLRIFSRTRDTMLWWNKIAVGGDSQQIDSDRQVIFTNTVTVRMHTDYTLIMDESNSAVIERIYDEVIAKLSL